MEGKGASCHLLRPQSVAQNDGRWWCRHFLVHCLSLSLTFSFFLITLRWNTLLGSRFSVVIPRLVHRPSAWRAAPCCGPVKHLGHTTLCCTPTPLSQRYHFAGKLFAPSFITFFRSLREILLLLKRQFHCYSEHTRVGTLIVATIYCAQLIQNRYMFRSFTVLQCSHQHCVQPVASDVEVVGYL